MNVGPAVSSRLALQRFFDRTDFVTSKTSIFRRSGPGSAAPFKGSRPDRLVFTLSTLDTSQAARRCLTPRPQRPSHLRSILMRFTPGFSLVAGVVAYPANVGSPQV